MTNASIWDQVPLGGGDDGTPRWDPGKGQDGDWISGTIADIEVADMKFGPTPIIKISCTAPPVQNGANLPEAATASPQNPVIVKFIVGLVDALYKLKEQKPNIGDGIQIVRTGTHKTQQGSIAVDFSVTTTPAAAAAQPAPAAQPAAVHQPAAAPPPVQAAPAPAPAAAPPGATIPPPTPDPATLV